MTGLSGTVSGRSPSALTLHLGAVVVGSEKPVGLAFWCAVIVILVAFEVVARRDSHRLPTAGQMVQRYLHHPVVRVGAVAVWLFAGWHLFSH